MSDIDQLNQLCLQLGATPQQANSMSRQLMKRAEQLASERGITEVEAMEHLLKVLIKGRQGDVYVEPPSDAG